MSTAAVVHPSTSTFAPGSIVVVRDEEWHVNTMDSIPGGWLLHVTGVSGLVKDQEATFSTTIDQVETLDPISAQVVPDESAKFRDSRLWLEATVRRTAIPITEPNLTISPHSLVDALPYQERAVQQALSPENLRPRILLADAVGLGKTIEIGMILSELVRRGRGDRILIVTPKHVLEQMQFEMWTRFALPFIRLDSTGIQRIRQELPAGRNPFTFYKRVIISIDTLKSDQYIPHLRSQRWDAVVIDESHNVTNTATQNHRLADLLARNTEALILASATPHNGRTESFAELVRMLEPSAVSPTNELDKNLLKRLVIRRHRHSPEVAQVVGADWAERLPPDNREVPASREENAIATELEQTWLWPEAGKAPSRNRLFPWTLAKAFLSSPQALAETIASRLARIDSETNLSDNNEREREALLHLQHLNTATLTGGSAKLGALIERLKEIGVGPRSAERAVVFAERIPTLHWVRENLIAQLKLKADQVAILHGGLSDVEQQAVVESFKLESSPIRVLVTGDVASEGVNLHAQCHNLIHFDIPWSLIRIEQRNGRIDRYGQRKRPQITTLLLKPDAERFAGDFRVLTRLIDREHEAHQALGDAASLIGTYDVKAEEDAILQVIRGDKSFDDAVRSPNQVSQANDLAGMLASLFAEQEAEIEDDATPPAPAPAPSVADTAVAATEFSTKLFESEVSFLDSALHAVFANPGDPQGLGWKHTPNHQFARLNPSNAKDLQQRLQVLPQTYLRDRDVHETLRLATTKNKGERELRNARTDDSTSQWPESHFLAPLHPVLDWVSDRVTALLARGHVYALSGQVSLPTVLLLGTLTNARGQVIAATYQTAAFFSADSAPMTQVHASAADAFAHLQLAQRNTQDLPTSDNLTPLIAPAVRAVRENIKQQVAAIEAETQRRVTAWQQRATAWRHEADALAQRRELRDRTQVVIEERALAESMLPERTLVRPLAVVVPQEGSLGV